MRAVAGAKAGLAAARWGQGDRARAVALWEEAAAAAAQQGDASLSAIRMRLALAYLDVERPTDAEALLRRETAEADNPAAHLYLAMMRSMEDSGEARRELAAIGEGAPPAVAATRDYVLEVLDKAEAAHSPAEAAKVVGLAWVQMEEWQLARAALERALRLDASDAETLVFLGHSEAALGRPAFEHLTAGVAARPDWPPGHYLLGLYYVKQGVFGLAAEEFQTMLRLDAGNAQAQADLARAHLGLGQYEAAEEALMAAVTSAPDNLAFRLALARFYANHAYRVAERGLPAAQAAADLAPDDAQARELLGWMYFLAGDIRLARLHLESALRLDPELASAYYRLGMIEKNLGRKEAAGSAFERAIDLDTDGFYREQAETAMRQLVDW
jgi:tetratricopeptide (TPR) repeat protein